MAVFLAGTEGCASSLLGAELMSITSEIRSSESAPWRMICQRFSLKITMVDSSPRCASPAIQDGEVDPEILFDMCGLGGRGSSGKVRRRHHDWSHHLNDCSCKWLAWNAECCRVESCSNLSGDCSGINRKHHSQGAGPELLGKLRQKP